MNDNEASRPNKDAIEGRYIGGYNSLIKETLAKRSASVEAGFFLPHLRRGMRLLDCGCGPGTITVDLAEVIAPGEAVGIDIEAQQHEIGRAFARERGVSNIRFETGNLYDLQYPPESFDAVFAHAVLYHLKDPRQALAEMHRVLTTGGLIGIRDFDSGGSIFTPSNPTLDNAFGLINRVLEDSGGNPLFGRSQRSVLRQIGFVNIQVSASYDSYGTSESTLKAGEYLAELISAPDNARIILEQKWASQSELDEMSAAFKAWGQHPDAFWARARCEAVGWKE